MTETLLLCSLLSSPVYAVRDAATKALSARPDALPVLTALQAHGDPETRLRCEMAAQGVRRMLVDGVITGSVPLDDRTACEWADRFGLLEACAYRHGYLPGDGTIHFFYDPNPASVRQLVGWCRNQALPRPLRWPWNGTSWQFCATQWKW